MILIVDNITNYDIFLKIQALYLIETNGKYIFFEKYDEAYNLCLAAA